MLPRQRPRKRRKGELSAVPTRASDRGQAWTDDFVFEPTGRGQLLTMLIVLAECTRECHRIKAGRRDSAPVSATLEENFGEHRAPTFLRSDNGGAFIAEQLKARLAQRGTAKVYIAPGHPRQNGDAESFNGKSWDECLTRRCSGARRTPRSSSSAGDAPTTRNGRTACLGLGHWLRSHRRCTRATAGPIPRWATNRANTHILHR